MLHSYPEFIHYSTFAVQSCIIVSQGSTHHLLLMMCKCKLNSSLSVRTCNASETKHMDLQGTTLLLWARATADARNTTSTMQHQRAAAEHQSSQQTQLSPQLPPCSTTLCYTQLGQTYWVKKLSTLMLLSV